MLPCFFLSASLLLGPAVPSSGDLLALAQQRSPFADLAPRVPLLDSGTQAETPAAFFPGYPGGGASGTPSGETPKEGEAKEAEKMVEPKRRSLPSPWDSPPFPGTEYQGYPLIGVPINTTRYPLMKFLQGTWPGDLLDSQRIQVYGWVNASYNWTNAHNSNTPTSYWIAPNRLELDQLLLRFERQADTVQTDHMDWGFRFSNLYGIDYRYMTAGGWLSYQLLKHNSLYGYDPTELYLDVYYPWMAQGLVVRIGRWIACPDIETQFAPDNYLGSHSILFTFDTYTQTGIMCTWKLTDQWMFQLAINAGNDMAPWYRGAVPCGFVGLRWVAKDNNNAFYTCLNQINNAEFSHFQQYGQPLGHDNFNYLVSTWEHRFNPLIHTKTESYIMWQHNAEVGGTPSAGPLKWYGGGGGDGVHIPGISLAYGVLNYSMFAISKNDFITVRNEWWRDEKGMRSGFTGTYSSHTIGLTHNFSPIFQVRPEFGYYRNWTQPAFDLGTKKGLWMAAFDFTIRF
jgi:hypothetical protein